MHTVEPTKPTAAGLEVELRARLGADRVRDDAATRALYSEDIWSAPTTPVALVASVQSLDEIVATMKAAFAAGVPVAPRGAGMSYTSSHIPVTADTLSLDLAGMNRVLDVNPADMTVTVEPGCTWATLNDALRPHGVRTPFWGPMSGLRSTVGGGVTQLNAMLGAGHYGTSSESVVALTVVLADGSILKTGARGRGGDAPFYRFYGPDLTGLFCGDSGTLGIKASITLRLIRLPAHEDYASFSFPTGEALVAALAEVARAGIASETCGFDPGLTRVRMKRMSLVSDVKTLGAVIGKEKSLAKGMISAARVALSGRNFIDDGDYPLHIIAEGRSAVGVAADIAAARRIATAHGGHEIENTIAKVIRAVPFPPLNSMLGPEGEAWVPVHGIVALSDAAACFTALQALFAELAALFATAGVATGFLFTSVSTNAVMIEPVFFWPHGYRPIHASAVEAIHLARLPRLAPNPAATAIVGDARQRVMAIFATFGAAHFQIGRAYPYRASRDDASLFVLDAIKAAVDAHGQLNPGGLGFPVG